MPTDLLTRLRRETPACETLLHFNNAGAALMPDPGFSVLTDYLEAERVMGGYEAEAVMAPQLDRFYRPVSCRHDCHRLHHSLWGK